MLKAFADGRLFGATYGTGSPWVLALHGWRRTHRDFDAVLVDVAAVALDLPGFGGSTPPPPAPWGPADYAQAVRPVLEDLDSRVVVLGHSYGGRVALHLAVACPERVRALVVTGAPFLRSPRTASRRPHPLPHPGRREPSVFGPGFSPDRSVRLASRLQIA